MKSDVWDNRMDLDPPFQRTVLLAGLKFNPFLPAHADPVQLQPPVVVLIRTQRMTVDTLRNLLSRNLHDAVRWIATAAQSGFPAAQVVWGQLLLDGRGVARDHSGAFSWFEKAAGKGDIEARNMLGRCYEQGWGVAANPKLAIDAFELAAQKGHVWGQVNLAQMLMRGGDPLDRPRCFTLFKAASESGTTKPHLKAMNSLARFLEEGWDGSPSPAAAAFWYLKAARLGDHWAQFNLATILFRQGKNEAAYRWLRTAIAISDNGFRRRVAPLLLAQPEPALRQIGLDALEFCTQGIAPDDLYAYGLALDHGIAGNKDPITSAALFGSSSALGNALAGEQIQSNSLSAVIRRRACEILSSTRFLLRFTGLPTKTHGNTNES